MDAPQAVCPRRLYLEMHMKKLIAAWLIAIGMLGCGGGGTDTGPGSPPTGRLVGEIIGTPAEIQSAELVSNAGYTGYVPTSNALQDAGKQNLLDMLFVFHGAGTVGRSHNKVADDAEAKLAQYVADNQRLLTPGVRVLIMDEVYWNPPDASDAVQVLQPQLDALQAGVALVRKYIPHAKVGITVTPYAASGRPNTLAYIQRAVALVDWVGTDPYWFGDAGNVQELHAWSGSFHGIAKQANPRVETWFIAQAFKDPRWDTTTFNAYMAQQLAYADQYDHLIFFGWQHTSELDSTFAGRHFSAETKRVYSKYLKSPPT